VTGYSLILIVGPQHSRSNADKIRAWATAEKTRPEHLREFVRDWRDRKFLAPKEADALIAGAT
jgi:hypothetical protein